jgi:hypothetical protein
MRRRFVLSATRYAELFAKTIDFGPQSNNLGFESDNLFFGRLLHVTTLGRDN